jgi:hypothetical protein
VLSKTKVALAAAIVLSIVFPTSAATKHHRVTRLHFPANWRLSGEWRPRLQ